MVSKALQLLRPGFQHLEKTDHQIGAGFVDITGNGPLHAFDRPQVLQVVRKRVLETRVDLRHPWRPTIRGAHLLVQVVSPGHQANSGADWSVRLCRAAGRYPLRTSKARRSGTRRSRTEASFQFPPRGVCPEFVRRTTRPMLIRPNSTSSCRSGVTCEPSTAMMVRLLLAAPQG